MATDAADKVTGKGSPEGNKQQYAADPQTGKVFLLVREGPLATALAIFSVLYLLVLLAFFFWQLFDVAVGRQYLLPRWAGYVDSGVLSSPSTRLIAYAFLGGAIGGIINEIRSLLYWHCEENAFGWRFLWKSVSAPWLGAALALLVYAIIRGGIAVFTGGSSSDTGGATAGLSALGVGGLAGYGSRKVSVWLDLQVNRLFSAPGAPSVDVPDLSDKTRDEADKALKDAGLLLGKVREERAEDAKVGKVIRQFPAAGAVIKGKGRVDVTIGVKRP